MTAFAKSSQLRTHQSTLWSDWITAQDCLDLCKFDILPGVPTPFYISWLVLVPCITPVPVATACQWVAAHIWKCSLSFLPWQYGRNTTVISGKHVSMYTFFMPLHLWRSKNDAWRYWEKRHCKAIIPYNSKEQRFKKGLSNSNLNILSPLQFWQLNKWRSLEPAETNYLILMPSILTVWVPLISVE